MVSKIKTQGGPGGKLGLSVGGGVRKPRHPGVKRQGGPGGKLDRGLFAIAKKISARAELIARAAPHSKDFGTSGGHRNEENRFLNVGCGVHRGGTSGQEENAQIRVGNSTGSSTRNTFASTNFGREGISGVFQKLFGWLGKR